LSLVTLGWLAIALGMILFQIINKFFSVQAIDFAGRFEQSQLKVGLASVFILTPVFLAISAWLHHHYKIGKLNHKSGIHRWLTYLMLFVSALTIIGRLIYQLFRFLDGDYAAAVILKTLVILAIAGGIFGYYLYDLIRQDFRRRSKTSFIALVLVIIVAIAAMVGGFLIIDPPAKARAMKFDQQRVNNLYELNSLINDYYRENKQLPADLSADRFSYFQDPQTEQKYEYKVLGEKEYELCAEFALAVDLNSRDYYYSGNKDWSYHQAGRQCFSNRVVDDSRLAPVEVIKQ